MTIQVLEGVFTDDQHDERIQKVTEAMTRSRATNKGTRSCRVPLD